MGTSLPLTIPIKEIDMTSLQLAKTNILTILYSTANHLTKYPIIFCVPLILLAPL